MSFNTVTPATEVRDLEEEFVAKLNIDTPSQKKVGGGDDIPSAFHPGAKYWYPVQGKLCQEVFGRLYGVSKFHCFYFLKA